jgi:trimeric autotransporter adhesin
MKMHALLVRLWLLLGAGMLSAQAPQGTAFTYQGALRQDGSAVNGTVDMVFDLFDAATAGNAVGPTLAFTAANGNAVIVDDGVFTVTLDFGVTAFNVPVSDQRFLRVTVNGTALAPRTPVQNAPYALQARTSELAYTVSNGSIGTAQINASQVQRRISATCASGSSIRTVAQDGSVTCQTDANSGGTLTGVVAGTGLSGGGSTGSVSIAADTSVLQRRVSGICASGSSVRTVNADGTVICQSSGSGTITGVTAGNGMTGGGTSGAVTLGIATPLTVSANGDPSVATITAIASGGGTGGTALRGNAFQENGQGVVGEILADSGSGIRGEASTANSTGVFGRNDAISGPAFGVRGNSSSPTGTAVVGYATSVTGTATGVSGQTSSDGGTAVRGRAADSVGAGLGGGIGVLGESGSGTGVRGTGTFGVWGSGYGAGGRGVSGTGDFTGVHGSSQDGYGVQAFSVTNTALRATSSIGMGIHGSGHLVGVRGDSSSTSGVLGTGTTGVRGESTTTSGFGVAGVNSAGSGVTWGVYGQTTSTGGYGIEGYNPNGVGVRGNGGVWAGQFIGNVQVQGSLSKSAGSFQIDHPLDPANKYLFHSFVESPDMKNIYDGVAVLDARGEASIDMPAYFEALNRDFRYQLTAIGRPAPALHVADEIAGNRFRVAGGGPGQKISWQVTGTRKDAYAEAHRIEAEVDKPASERGKYLHPALFGADASKAIHAGSRVLPPGAPTE